MSATAPTDTGCQDPAILALAARLAAAPVDQRARLTAALADAQRAYRASVTAVMAGCRALGIDEDTRRGMIRQATAGRTDSLRHTTAAERAGLAKHLERAGYRRPARRRAVTVTPPATWEGVHSKIKALLADAGRTYPYADAIARKRFGVDCWEWLDHDSACKLMQMLIMDQSRRARRAAQAGAAT